MEQKTKKWLVAGALTIAVAIGVGTCYSNTSDKSGRENKEAVASKEDKNKPKEAKAAQKDKKSYYPLTKRKVRMARNMKLSMKNSLKRWWRFIREM